MSVKTPLSGARREGAWYASMIGQFNTNTPAGNLGHLKLLALLQRRKEQLEISINVLEVFRGQREGASVLEK
jgi:hypothetical protein